MIHYIGISIPDTRWIDQDPPLVGTTTGTSNGAPPSDMPPSGIDPSGI